MKISSVLSDDRVFTIKEGDRHPDLEISLVDKDGNPLDLTPYPTIRLVIAPSVGGRRIVDMALMMKKGLPTEGKVVYAWAAGQTDRPGEYLLEVILSPDATKLMTLPGGSYGKLIITPRL